MSEASRFPLAWPAHKPRTPSTRQKAGKFAANGSPISMAAAIKRAMDEIGRLGGIYGLISSNVEVRLDGLPRSGQRAPADPGVCLYFQLRGKPYAMACDAYTKVEQNLAAIAAHIEATRAIERHGVATAAETLQAFVSLPSNAAPAPRPWWDVLGLPRSTTRARLEAQYRLKARSAHPDAGGSDAAMSELNAARDAGLTEVG